MSYVEVSHASDGWDDRMTRDEDDDVRREFRRGATFSVTLPRALRHLLDAVVSGELVISQHRLEPRRRRFSSRTRTKSRIAKLVRLGYLRYERDSVVPTVAGIGAVRCGLFSTQSAEMEDLRALRRAELDNDTGASSRGEEVGT